jgi:hypothetical protein
MTKATAAAHIAAWSRQNIDAADTARFVETAETGLLGMHDDNYARYWIRPAEYQAWRSVWDDPPKPVPPKAKRPSAKASKAR